MRGRPGQALRPPQLWPSSRAARCPGGRACSREGLGRTALGESGRAQGEGDLGQPARPRAHRSGALRGKG